MTARLLLDIGNSRVKWGVLDAGRLVATGALAHSGEAHAWPEAVPPRLAGALAANVAGAGPARSLAASLRRHAGVELEFLSTAREGWGVVCGYRDPARLGVDRWAAMIGARARHRDALLVVDAGTALTIDALAAGGRHLGGMIVPGLSLLGAALTRSTSDIADSGDDEPDAEGIALFADDTGRAVLNGARIALAGAVRAARGLFDRAAESPRIVLTGGDAPRILGLLEADVEHRPHLVLEGLAVVAGGKA